MITSKENPHFKRLLKLHKPKEREEEGVFLVEGERELSLAPKVESVYYTDHSLCVDTLEKKGVLCTPIAPDLFQRISYRDRGVIGIVPKMRGSFSDLEKANLLLLVEKIEKPGNLGAMMRSLDGAGGDGLIVVDPVTDLFNPNVVRASLGAFFSFPVVESNLEEALNFLMHHKMQIVVTTPHVRASYAAVDYTLPTCIVIGCEAEGITSRWTRLDKIKLVSLPMNGKVDSLNASVTAGILLYEAIRQRSSLL